MAELGKAELDRQEDEQKVDQASVQEDNVEGNVEEAEGCADGTRQSYSQHSERCPEPQRLDMSPRGMFPKRRVGDDDMEDDSLDKRPRLRSPTISYRTDAESVGSNMDDPAIDMLNDIDKKILSASIMGDHIIEVYSPERVA